MAEYQFSEIEKKWQQYWADHKVFQTREEPGKPKYYVLDMFPYPSGAGLHVGHPLGYIATDIIARYKRLKGFNVLHPMGFDSFGLPAEQYAIKTGQHPAVTTANNIKRFKEQLSILGFSYDWEKEVRTSDPTYYKWTQWIFLKLFNSYFDEKEKKAKPISELPIPEGLSESEKRQYINDHRLTYQDEVAVNWCPALGTVLANEEVIGGVSERGGHPVIRKPMRQWMMRITKYADRLLEDLDDLDWPESIKLSQKNWIGRSVGAEISFAVAGLEEKIEVFTTRPDTIYGVTYLTLAPEHHLVDKITTPENAKAVKAYQEAAANKSDLERQELDKTKTGVFTGGFVINPLSGEKVPVWISDYVLVSYGTGAVMAVPGHDQRDFEFAQKFDIPIRQVISDDGKEKDSLEEAFAAHGIVINSGENDGMQSQDFKATVIERLEKEGTGKASVNYKLRDWVFTRQRYWGEPIPVIHTEDGEIKSVPEDQLPVTLPEVDAYKPAEDGSSPLARNQEWVNTVDPETGKPSQRETNTMPQWAGSCWYYLRYLQPWNTDKLAEDEALKYWTPVDLYVGGAEHAVLHLLYARFWHKVLFDLGVVPTREPFQKLVNQGMIQGRSNFIYRIKGENKYVSYNLRNEYEVTPLHVDVALVTNDILDTEALKQSSPDYKNAEFILEDGQYVCGVEVEKMSKSKMNVVNPDDIIEKYGADCMRMYEMFLGPLEQNKPWNTNGIDGVFKFIRKTWNLFHDNDNNLIVNDEKPSKEELKVLHKAIKKTADDIERLSLNTAVSNFMITVNELTSLKCHKREILEPLSILLAPFAPHIAEELWHKLGHEDSITYASMPAFDEQYLQEDAFEYPIMVNGKLRAKMTFAVDTPQAEIQKAVLDSDTIQKWTDGKPPKKVIIVPKKIVNVVI